MRFTKIRLSGLYSVDLPIIGALPSDPYILKASDGLGPPEVDVSIAETLEAGGVYQRRQPQLREIVLRVGLNPDYSQSQTPSDLRSSLYGLMTPGSEDLVLVDLLDGDDIVAQTSGYMKRLEIAPFSETPEVQLTIACLQPYLQAPSILYITPTGDRLNPQIENLGTAPAGLYMEIVFSQPQESWALSFGAGKKIEFVHNFLVGDELSFDTRAGSRGIWLTREFIKIPLMSALTIGSRWPVLHGGLNTFTTSSQFFDWGDVFYRPQYWGI